MFLAIFSLVILCNVYITFQLFVNKALQTRYVCENLYKTQGLTPGQPHMISTELLSYCN